MACTKKTFAPMTGDGRSSGISSGTATTAATNPP
jgi:hypothetical protein